MPNIVVTRENGGFVVRQGGPVGPTGPAGPPGPAGGGDVTQAELDDAVAALQAAIDDRQLSSEKGGVNGYAALDAGGHVPAAQLTLAALVYKGTWDAATNAPSLVDGTGTSGDSYRVAVAGTRNLGSGSKDWEIGDFALYNGTIWEQLGGATGVSQTELDNGLATKADTSHTHAQSDVTGLVAALDAKQNLHANLTALAGPTFAANSLPLFTGPNAATGTLFQPFMQVVSQFGTDAATVRGILGVGTGGTTVMPINAKTGDYTFVLADPATPQVFAMDWPAALKNFRIPLESEVPYGAGTMFPLIVDVGGGGMAISPGLSVNELLADSPALLWRLAESSGTNANDETANNRDGTYVAAPTFGAVGPPGGYPDTAVDLDGSTEYITSTYNPFANGAARTFEGWAWRDTSTTEDVLFAGDAAGGVVPALRIDANSTNVSFFSTLAAGQQIWTAAWPGNAQWVHWALTFDETTNAANLYINGASAAGNPKTQANAYNAAPGNFKVGARQASTVGAFDGKMALIAVYTTALSVTRIKMHHDAGRIRIRSENRARQAAAQNVPLALHRYAADDWLLVGGLA